MYVIDSGVCESVCVVCVCGGLSAQVCMIVHLCVYNVYSLLIQVCCGLPCVNVCICMCVWCVVLTR